MLLHAVVGHSPRTVSQEFQNLFKRLILYFTFQKNKRSSKHVLRETKDFLKTKRKNKKTVIITTCIARNEHRFCTISPAKSISSVRIVT